MHLNEGFSKPVLYSRKYVRLRMLMRDDACAFVQQVVRFRHRDRYARRGITDDPSHTETVSTFGFSKLRNQRRSGGSLN
jgi:hypothetical protein